MPRQAPLDERPSRDAYPSWLRRKFKIDAVAKGRAYYETVASRLRDQFVASAFWDEANRQLPALEADYRLATNYELLVGGPRPVLTKGWDRFLDKTYRRNVQDNDDWPNEPEGGWLVPPAWFSSVSDTVRTMLVVKYLDGVDFLGTALEKMATEAGCRCTPSLQNTELGYYAAHLVVAMPMDVPLPTWDIERRNIRVEIQVTTQIQEVIRNLLHPHYERRQSGIVAPRPWQWEYMSHEFSANYLGHILHYVEGQIMKVREDS